MMFTIDQIPRSAFGFGWHHEAALTLCQQDYHACPFGCTKDGAPNCAVNVSELRCEPARQTLEQARQKHQQMKMAKQAHLETLTKKQLPHLLERRETVLVALSGILDIDQEGKLLDMLEWLEEQIDYLQR